jgi:hypothetical protein
MALTFPLPVTWFTGLPVAESRFDLTAGTQISRTRGGAVHVANIAERLWTGSVVLVPRRHADAVRIAAQLDALREARGSALIHPYPLAVPASDPGGVLLGASTPTLHTIGTGGRSLRITGLPAGYQLRAGDFVGFSYGSDPTRYALHRLVEDATASGAGLTPNAEVVPPIRAGVSTGTAITLIRPAIRAVILPAQSTGTHRPGLTEGIAFDFVQTF